MLERFQHGQNLNDIKRGILAPKRAADEIDIMKKVAQMQHEAELRNEKKETDISNSKEDLLYN